MAKNTKQTHWFVALLLRLFLILVILVASGAGYAWYWLHQPLGISAESYLVARGASVTSIGNDLHSHDQMQYPRLWRIWAHATHQSAQIKAGEYAIDPGLSPDALLKLFASGKVILHSIQFIEGATFAEMRRVVDNNALIEHTLNNVSDAEIMRRLNLSGTHPEGQFFPDTYDFSRGTSDLEIYALSQRRMQKEWQQAWATREKNLPLKNAYEALVLASIVEKESALASERPKVAGVFVERLERGMRLQTDPTIIYGLGAAYDGNIHKSDLQRDTPYNTYTRDGLPPTPICLPGAGALHAATHPERSGALYFVATGEGGAHHFSKTYEEHAQEVAKLIKMQRAHRNE